MTKLEKLLDEAQGIATKIFNESGDLTAMWHGQNEKDENLLFVTPFGNDREKDMTLEAVKDLFVKHNVVRFVFMTEVWFKSYQREGFTGVPKPISEMADRREALFLIGEDKNTGECISVTR